MIFDNFAFRIYESRDYGQLMLWLPKLLLGSIFMWPNRKNRMITTIVCFILTMLIIFTGVGILFYAKNNIQNFNEAAYAMCLIVVTSLPVSKCLVLWYNIEELENLLQDIKTKFWPHDVADEDTTIFLKRMYEYLIFFMFCFYGLGQIYMGILFFFPIFSEKRVLPFPCDLPIEWTVSPIYELLYFLQVFSTQLGLPVGALGVDYLVMSLCINATSQYRILQKCFLALNTNQMVKINDRLRESQGCLNKNYDIKKEYFIRCVRHHAFLSRFIKKLNHALSPLELGQLVISVIGICLGMFILSRPDISTTQLIQTLIFTTGISFQLAIDCFVGTDLYYQATIVPDCIFKSNWTAIEDKEFRIDIMFALEHSQRYPVFSSYGLYILNMDSYAKVLKMAFSIYTFLTNISKK